MKELSSISQYEELKQQSSSGPVLIMKHSTRCTRSASAFDEMKRFSEDNSQELEVVILDLLEHRDISALIEEDTGIQHESPQLFIFLNGSVMWESHHWEVTAENIEKALGSIEAK